MELRAPDFRKSHAACRIFTQESGQSVLDQYMIIIRNVQNSMCVVRYLCKATGKSNNKIGKTSIIPC